jgi:hypothetical protein
MTSPPRIAVFGAGIVGVRATRELLTPSPDGSRAVSEVTLVSRRPDRLEQLVSSFGSSVRLVSAEQTDPAVDADVVIVARAADEQLGVAERALRSGAHVVTTCDAPDPVEALLALDHLARSVGRALVIGAAMSPGLSCLLVRHAAGLLDEVDEVHVAREGAGGPACARQRLRALRGTATEWRDGAWVRRGGFSGRELCWFPDPIGAHDCYRAELAEPLLLVDAFPSLDRATARLAASRLDRTLVPVPVLVGPPVEGKPGAVRVEVRGRRGRGRESVVYGALDRPSVASGATAAVAALAVAGDGPFWSPARGARAGAHGLGAVTDPLPLLRELARRGVRAAAFEGSEELPRSSPDQRDADGGVAESVQVSEQGTDTTTQSDI